MRPATTIQILVVLLISAATGIGLAHHDRTAPAIAEEKAIHVSLGYLRGYSNWGPTDVYGTAQIWPREAVANIAVHNLPHLPSGLQYQWWVVNMQSGAAMRMGAFNTTEAGDAFQDAYLPHGMPLGANAVVVSISQGKGQAARPGTQRTMSGYFAPTVQTAPHSGAGAGTEVGGSGSVPGLPPGSSTGDGPSADARQRPYAGIVELPRTGGGAPPSAHH